MKKLTIAAPPKSADAKQPAPAPGQRKFGAGFSVAFAGRGAKP